MRIDVLIVDGRVFMAKDLVIELGDNYYSIRTALSGKEGLSIASRKTPHVVLCAEDLPDMGAREFRDALRGRQETLHLPVVVLLDKGENSHEAVNVPSGFEGALPRTFESRELIATIHEILGRPPSAG